MTNSEIKALAPWFHLDWAQEYRYYICPRCNAFTTGDFAPVPISDVLAWLNRDLMKPDYAALAAEPVAATAEQDSRDSAGLEG
jgi:hypothetical protein